MLLGVMILSFSQTLGLLFLCVWFIGYKLASFAKSDPDKAITWAKFLSETLSKKR